MNHTMPKHSEYRIEDAISRLEGFCRHIGPGQLTEDIQVAIECMEHLRDSIRLADAELITDMTRKHHLIIMDHGFAGMSYKCSACGVSAWGVPKGDIRECPHCHVELDPNETEYGFY